MAELLLQIDQWLITFCLHEWQQLGLSLYISMLGALLKFTLNELFVPLFPTTLASSFQKV